MKQSITHCLARPIGLVLMACTGLLSVSCSLLQRNTETKSTPAQPTPAQHLAQMNFGRQAEFGLCIPPACPTVTSKTLAPLPRATLPETRSSATVSLLDEGKAIAPESHGTTTVAPSPAPTAPKTVTVHFRFAKAALSLETKKILNSAVAAVPEATRISISGRTDNVGTDSVNEALAVARARAVYEYLATRHPRLKHLLQSDAQGACCYVSPNDTEQGRSRNRRVDVRISRNGDARP